MKRFEYRNTIIIFSIASLLVMSPVFVGAQPAPAAFSVDERQDIPKRLLRKFKRDAARLALRMESQTEDLRFQSIYIPRENVELIFNVLVKIYSGNETARSIAKCNVHTYPNPSIDHFKVVFDRNVDWATPLQQGISETDSEVINRLLDEYELVIDNHEQWTETEDVIVIRSKELLNMAALANEFYNVQGVVEIDLGIPEVGGNDIQISRFNDGWEVEYILKFGSYINGNGKAHNWKYKVMDNGDIIFPSETGDPIPSWMRCKTNETTGSIVSKG